MYRQQQHPQIGMQEDGRLHRIVTVQKSLSNAQQVWLDAVVKTQSPASTAAEVQNPVDLQPGGVYWDVWPNAHCCQETLAATNGSTCIRDIATHMPRCLKTQSRDNRTMCTLRTTEQRHQESCVLYLRGSPVQCSMSGSHSMTAYARLLLR